MERTARTERLQQSTSAQRWVLALSALASFMVVLDMLVVATALTAIQRDLGASLEELEWTVNAYTLSFAVLLMTGATLGDRYGRRRMFAAGLGLFAAASAACALATDTSMLIAARTVQGAGAAMIMPLALALLNGAFPPERRGWATGIYGSVTALAAILGPVVGGAITQGLAWQWIFWLNVPIGLTAIPFVLGRIRESRGPAAAVDLPGLALAAAAALGIMWTLVRGNSAGWSSRDCAAARGRPAARRRVRRLGAARAHPNAADAALPLRCVLGRQRLDLLPQCDLDRRHTIGGIGLALAVPAVTKSVVSLVAPQDIGRASGTFSTTRQLGGAFGVARRGLRRDRRVRLGTGVQRRLWAGDGRLCAPCPPGRARRAPRPTQPRPGRHC